MCALHIQFRDIILEHNERLHADLRRAKISSVSKNGCNLPLVIRNSIFISATDGMPGLSSVFFGFNHIFCRSFLGFGFSGGFLSKISFGSAEQATLSACAAFF